MTTSSSLRLRLFVSLSLSVFFFFSNYSKSTRRCVLDRWVSALMLLVVLAASLLEVVNQSLKGLFLRHLAIMARAPHPCRRAPPPPGASSPRPSPPARGARPSGRCFKGGGFSGGSSASRRASRSDSGVLEGAARRAGLLRAWAAIEGGLVALADKHIDSAVPNLRVEK